MSTPSLESSKMLAGIGTILLIFSAVPVVGIIGIILLAIGLKGLADYYKDENIFGTAVWGAIFGIIGIIALSAGVFGSVITSVTTSIVTGGIGAIFGALAFIGVIVIAFIFFLLMAINFRRCLNALADRTGENLFRTAGTLLFFGAILTIILVGFILIFIAWLIATIAFFSIKTTPQQPYTYGAPPPTTQPPVMQGTRYCPNCGSPVDATATFCPHCGKQLPPA